MKHNPRIGVKSLWLLQVQKTVEACSQEIRPLIRIGAYTSWAQHLRFLTSWIGQRQSRSPLLTLYSNESCELYLKIGSFPTRESSLSLLIEFLFTKTEMRALSFKKEFSMMSVKNKTHNWRLILKEKHLFDGYQWLFWKTSSFKLIELKLLVKVIRRAAEIRKIIYRWK